MIRTASMAGNEPGHQSGLSPRSTRRVSPTSHASQIVESFARNFMHAIDTWQENGFGAVAQGHIWSDFRARAGVRRDIDDNGDLLIRAWRAPKSSATALLPRLARAVLVRSDVTKGPRA